MARILIRLEGEHFRRQYLIYIIEIAHEDDRYYYVGQTGDRKYITARPAFRRLAGHFEDIGRSTQNQIYRYLAAGVLGIKKAASKDSAFDLQTKQAVEDYLTESDVTMYAYPLQPFKANIDHEQHLDIVRRVTLFEQIVIKLFVESLKKVVNKQVTKSLDSPCPYQKVLNEIIDDFKLKQ